MFKKILFVVIACLWGVQSYSQCIPPKPTVQTSVYDYADLLSAEQKSALERKLIVYSDSTSTQIVVAVAKELCGQEIAMLATDWAHEWGIGQKGKDNGVFMLISPTDRKIFISTGYGVEGSLTDAMTRRIIETVILPEFKKGDYYQGIDLGVDAIFKVLTGEFKADAKSSQDDSSGMLVILFPILIAVLIIIAMFSNKGKNGGSNSGGTHRGSDSSDAAAAILTGILLGSMGRRSSGGGFGGGGFGGGGGFSGGFGGGGFGGGGAGGSW